MNKIAHRIKEHTRLFKNSRIGLRKDSYEYRYQIGYWHPYIHIEETDIQKYSIKRLREKLNSKGFVSTYFYYILFNSLLNPGKSMFFVEAGNTGRGICIKPCRNLEKT